MSNVPLPVGQFAAILADPPWEYRYWSKPTDKRRGTASSSYDCMTLSEICSLPVADLAEPNATLFLWATGPLLEDAFDVMNAWGFSYVTIGFTWVKIYPNNPQKPRCGIGYWTRSNVELCLFGKRGTPTRINTDVSQVIAAPIREHSRKPDETHERIERLVAGPYLELFGREQRPGWTVWGNETDKFVTHPPLFPPGEDSSQGQQGSALALDYGTDPAQLVITDAEGGE